MQDFCASSMWSNASINYSFSNSNGLSGGMLTIWKEGAVEVLYSFKAEGYLGKSIMEGSILLCC